ncbi:MAG: sulfatase-like hydrolase/transferase [bacterium]|nr:sulfatase-like hydrolase/transferase [bacterium]
MGLAAASAACPAILRSEAAARPNILFLFTDDQTFRSIGSLNNPAVKTPNIDRLVRNGVTFTHAFNQGSWTGAVCIASRAMLNTGRFIYHAQHDIGNAGKGEAPCVPLWSETLGRAGYDTFMTGKWHNGDLALKQGFKHVGPHGGGMLPSTEVGGEAYNRPAPGNTWTPYDPKWEGHWMDDGEGGIVHSSVRWANAAVDYLKGREAGGDPFFMYVAFHAPHDPRQSPKEYIDLYPLDEIQIPPNFYPEHPFDQGERYTLRDERLAPFPRTPDEIKVHIQEYYAIISHADAQIGRILDTLEASGEMDNTLIVFSADHGLAMGQHGLMGKQNQYDHSIRMPLIFCGPGLEKNKRIDSLVYLHNTYATTCELAGVEVPETVEFRSLAPLLRGETDRVYDAIFGSYVDFQRMVRTDRYKLIRYPKVGETQLFDLVEDPWEMNNLAGEKAYSGVLDRLSYRLSELQRQVGDELVLT